MAGQKIYRRMKAFEAKNIAKNFGHVKALSGVTLSAEQGKIFGFLGPNGAGKTTLIRILCTLIQMKVQPKFRSRCKKGAASGARSHWLYLYRFRL